MIKKIIADASPLIILSKIHFLPKLFQLVGTVLISELVAEECLANLALPGATIIKQAIKQQSVQIALDPAITHAKSFSTLPGKGEISAIELALHTKSPLLIDEKLGRSTAKKSGLKIIGTAGIFLLAKQHKLISKISPLITLIKQHNYYLSDTLTKELLKQANES